MQVDRMQGVLLTDRLVKRAGPRKVLRVVLLAVQPVSITTVRAKDTRRLGRRRSAIVEHQLLTLRARHRHIKDQGPMMPLPLDI